MRPVEGRLRRGGQSPPPPRPSVPAPKALYPAGKIARPTDRRAERKPMSRKAMQRLSFFLLMGLTLYAAFLGAG